MAIRAASWPEREKTMQRIERVSIGDLFGRSHGIGRECGIYGIEDHLELISGIQQ
jgi:hypothetical protein